MNNAINASSQAYAKIYVPGTTLLIAADERGADNASLIKFDDQVDQLRGEGLKLIVVDKPETAALIARERQGIYEAFLLSAHGGLKDKTGRTISIIDEHETSLALDDGKQRSDIVVDEERRPQVMAARQMLETVGKVALTRMDGLLGEMRTREGTGSLLYHSTVLTCSKVEPHERKLFEQVHKEHVATKMFRDRTREQIEELMDRAYAVRAKQAPIGFFAMKEHADGWNELSAVSSLIKNGAGKRLMDSALQVSAENGHNPPVFALSTNDDLVRFFERYGFRHRGKVSEAKATTDDPLPEFVKTYAVPGRDPHVLTKI